MRIGLRISNTHSNCHRIFRYSHYENKLHPRFDLTVLKRAYADYEILNKAALSVSIPPRQNFDRFQS